MLSAIHQRRRVTSSYFRKRNDIFNDVGVLHADDNFHVALEYLVQKANSVMDDGIGDEHLANDWE